MTSDDKALLRNNSGKVHEILIGDLFRRTIGDFASTVSTIWLIFLNFKSK